MNADLDLKPMVGENPHQLAYPIHGSCWELLGPRLPKRKFQKRVVVGLNQRGQRLKLRVTKQPSAHQRVNSPLLWLSNERGVAGGQAKRKRHDHYQCGTTPA